MINRYNLLRLLVLSRVYNWKYKHTPLAENIRRLPTGVVSYNGFSDKGWTSRAGARV
jgi:hypothetical protein